MARIRSLHPGLFTDESFMTLTVSYPLAAILLTGLWTEADDDGVFEWKPLTLKARILPAVAAPVDPLLDALVENRFVMRFEAGGRSYGAVRNFAKFQHPKKPNSIHPKPDEVRHYVGMSSEPVGNQFAAAGEKPLQMEEEEKNIRQDGSAVPRPEDPLQADEEPTEPSDPGKPARPRRRAQRIDPAWKPSDADRAFAVSVGIPEADIDRQAAEFVDYWTGVGGASGAKLDWPATWRNRCRQIAERKGYSAATTPPGCFSGHPLGWPQGFPAPERLFQIWQGGQWSVAAWGFPPGDPSCRIPPRIVAEWQQRKAEAA